ncbi:MAG TPA: DsbA family protein [Acidimicrobiales bacterium]|nr:DsbA family protein [Acidimicrobiales bacterium]
MIDVAPGTIAVYTDLGCPWSHLAVHRLLATRSTMGLDAEVTLDHRPFVLELVNAEPTPRRTLDAEIPVLGALGPGAGWQMWQAEESAWPVTMLLPMEAVQAAKDQSLQASEQLDQALRVAFFGESRCISLRHVILEVAAGCARVDVDALAEALDDGRARRALLDHHRAAVESDAVNGSPHLFLPDGTNAHNPGIEMHWEGEQGKGFPVVTKDDPSIYGDLLVQAARLAA